MPPDFHFQVTTVDVSEHAKSLMLIVEHNQAKQQRVTAAKLVDILRSQGSSSRPCNLPSVGMPVQQCERILVAVLLQGVLKEEFHFTAYTTICYMGLGRKAEAVRRGLLKIELPTLSACKEKQRSSVKPESVQRKEEGVPSGNSDTSVLLEVPSTAPECRVTDRLPSMLLNEDSPGGSSTGLLSRSTRAKSYDQNKASQQQHTSQKKATTTSSSHKQRSGLSLGKRKKRKRCAREDSASPSVPPKRHSTTHSTSSNATSGSGAVCDVIQIIDSD